MILVSWQCFWYNRKCLFSCIYNPQITILPTSSCTASFNGDRVKNHPKPWTCPLRKITEHFLFSHLSPPGCCWCDVLSFVPTGIVSSSSTLQILWDRSHLWWLLYLLSHFPSLWHLQGRRASVFKDGCQPLTHIPVWASHSTFHFFVASSLNLWGTSTKKYSWEYLTPPIPASPKAMHKAVEIYMYSLLQHRHWIIVFNVCVVQLDVVLSLCRRDLSL